MTASVVVVVVGVVVVITVAVVVEIGAAVVFEIGAAVVEFDVVFVSVKQKKNGTI